MFELQDVERGAAQIEKAAVGADCVAGQAEHVGENAGDRLFGFALRRLELAEIARGYLVRMADMRVQRAFLQPSAQQRALDLAQAGFGKGFFRQRQYQRGAEAPQQQGGVADRDHRLVQPESVFDRKGWEEGQHQLLGV
ncbi:hypothetical protein, partial [Chromobacterium piscinae]|uniref:hypothetical protein n=1 Tax=Chromobacterium piscinae TaxID=686831 RepID=UPI003261C292